MNTNKFKCLVVNRIKNPQLLSSIAFNNFKYLCKFPELAHAEENIYQTLTSSGNLCYLLYDNDLLIAYLIGDFRTLADNRYVYYISYFYIAEKYRNKKIGGKILSMLINKCRSEGLKFIVLTCDTLDDKNVYFYKKYGFVPDPLLGSNKRHNVYCLYL